MLPPAVFVYEMRPGLVLADADVNTEFVYM